MRAERKASMENNLNHPDIEPVPKRTRTKRKLLIVIIAAAVVIAAAIPFAVYMTLFRAGSLGRSFDDAVFDTGKLNKVLRTWESSGYEAESSVRLTSEFTGIDETLNGEFFLSGKREKDNYRHTGDLKLSVKNRVLDFAFYSDRDILAISGLDKNSDRYYSVPFENFSLGFSKSVFHPNSGTDYALSTNEYKEINDTVQELFNQIYNTIDEITSEVTRAFGNMMKECKEILNEKISFGFSSEAPWLYRQSRFSFDPETLESVVDVVIDELKENEELAEFFKSIDMTASDGSSVNGEEFIEYLIIALEDLKVRFKLSNISGELLYRVSGGKVTYIRLNTETPYGFGKNDTFEAILDFDFGISTEKVTLETREITNGINDFYYTEKLVFDYEKSGEGISFDGTKYSCGVIEGEEEDFIEEPLFKAKLETGKDDSFSLNVQTEDVSIEAEGTFKLSSFEKSLTFELNKLIIDESDKLSDSWFKIKISKLSKRDLKAPESESLFDMSVEQMDEFVRTFPMRDMILFDAALNGYDINMPETLDGYPIGPADMAEEKTGYYLSLVYEYYYQLQQRGYYADEKVCIYDYELGIYFLIDLYRKYTYDIKYLYEMTDEYSDYHEAYVRNGMLNVHDLAVKEVITAPGCDEEGLTEYRCNVCKWIIQLTEPATGHIWQYIETIPSTCTENGYNLYTCEKCGESTKEELPLASHKYMISEKVESTCIERGYEIYICDVCGDIQRNDLYFEDHSTAYRYTEIMLDNGKTYTDRVSFCSVCGAISEIDIVAYCDIRLSIQEDGSYIITDIIWDISSEEETPVFCLTEEIFEGIQISNLSAFLDDWRSEGIYSIRLPEGVEEIGFCNIMNERDVRVLVLPSTLKRIRDGSLYYNLPLKRIYFTGTEKEWAEIDLGPYRSIWKNVEIIFAPDGVEPGAFAGLLTVD